MDFGYILFMIIVALFIYYECMKDSKDDTLAEIDMLVDDIEDKVKELQRFRRPEHAKRHRASRSAVNRVRGYRIRG